MMLAECVGMFPRRPGRIKGFTYVGLHRYAVTICTHLRRPVFTTGNAVEPVLMLIRQCARSLGFAVPAYCFMPDHLHLVLAATGESSDFRYFMANWKQRAGYQHKQRTRMSLWQESYFDHVLRDDEELNRAVRYVLENPQGRAEGILECWTGLKPCATGIDSAEALCHPSPICQSTNLPICQSSNLPICEYCIYNGAIPASTIAREHDEIFAP